MPTKPDQIYQLKITLKDIRPPIWRRVLVSANYTLDELHDVIQAVMGWWDYHLHQYIVEGTYYGNSEYDEFDELGIIDETNVRLSQIVEGEGYKFDYEYDFGDSWVHEILLEKILPPEAGVRYPLCVKGKRARPPEDVGGVWGYEMFLEAIRDPAHEEHDSYLEWVGGEFDPEAFDLEATNRALKRIT